jgi:hypothetical protein
MTAERVEAVFVALADATRRQVLDHLAADECPATGEHGRGEPWLKLAHHSLVQGRVSICSRPTSIGVDLPQFSQLSWPEVPSSFLQIAAKFGSAPRAHPDPKQSVSRVTWKAAYCWRSDHLQADPPWQLLPPMKWYRPTPFIHQFPGRRPEPTLDRLKLLRCFEGVVNGSVTQPLVIEVP